MPAGPVRRVENFLLIQHGITCVTKLDGGTSSFPLEANALTRHPVRLKAGDWPSARPAVFGRAM